MCAPTGAALAVAGLHNASDSTAASQLPEAAATAIRGDAASAADSVQMRPLEERGQCSRGHWLASSLSILSGACGNAGGDGGAGACPANFLVRCQREWQRGRMRQEMEAAQMPPQQLLSPWLQSLLRPAVEQLSRSVIGH
jgi:hypothetical protein